MKLSNIGKDDDTTRIGEAVVSCLWRICCSLCCWRYAMRRWGLFEADRIFADDKEAQRFHVLGFSSSLSVEQ
jgi:hypothetical protein